MYFKAKKSKGTCISNNLVIRYMDFKTIYDADVTTA